MPNLISMLYYLLYTIYFQLPKMIRNSAENFFLRYCSKTAVIYHKEQKMLLTLLMSQ